MYNADAFVKFKEQQVFKHSADQGLYFHSWFLNKVIKQVNCVKYVNMNSKEKGDKSMCNITHWYALVAMHCQGVENLIIQFCPAAQLSGIG